MRTERLLQYESDAVGFIGNGATDKKIWSKEVSYESKTKFESCKKIDLMCSLGRWDQDENLGVGFI